MAGLRQGIYRSDQSPLAEPVDQAVGRSRGALTSKQHTLLDGGGRPLVLPVSAGSVNDSAVLPALLDHLAVRAARTGPAQSPAGRGDRGQGLLPSAHHAAPRGRREEGNP